MTFAAIHFFGGEHVKEIEAFLFKFIGPILKQFKKEEKPQDTHAFDFLKKWFGSEEKVSEMELLVARLSGEFVLAFTIHKTLMVPLRAGLTVLFTPSIVRWLVRKGWARPLKSMASTTA